METIERIRWTDSNEEGSQRKNENRTLLNIIIKGGDWIGHILKATDISNCA